MPLEATMICVDNSEYNRNGDYTPTRLEAQSDAVNLICGAKTQQNPENAVGVLIMGGERVQVLQTPTTDLGAMLGALSGVQPSGQCDFLRGIQTAQLALKHRQNKNQRQRIVCFVSSPITATEKQLETVGKNLKKNNVSIDLISIGEVEENEAKLAKLLQCANSNDTSHILEVPVGTRLLSDVLLSSAIINPDGEIPAAAGGGDGDAFQFGIDPSEDPELAMALRISMEEERARQARLTEAERPEGAEGERPPSATASAAANITAQTGNAPSAEDIAMIEDMGEMDDDLRQALLLSLQDSVPKDDSAAVEPETKKPKTESPSHAAAPAQAPAPASTSAPGGVDTSLFQDAQFMERLLGTLPGVNVNDPRIQEALKTVGTDSSTKEGDDDEKKKEDK